MARQNPPIYLVGGSKGGVGKSFVTLALVDYLQRTDINVVLVETDTSNPDVMKAVHAEIECVSSNLDDVSGWIEVSEMLPRVLTAEIGCVSTVVLPIQ